MDELLAAAVRAGDAFAKMLVIVDRTGWRGSAPADAATSDAIVAKLHRGRGTEKYTGKLTVASAFGLQGIATKIRDDLRTLRRIAADSLPADNLMFSSTGATLGATFYRELRLAHTAAERAATAYDALYAQYHPEGDLEINEATIRDAQELYLKFVTVSNGHLVIDQYLRLLARGLEIAPLVRSILAELELVKTSVLETPYTAGKSNRINSVQSLVQLYNLRPHNWELYSVADAYGQIGVRAKRGADPEDVAEALVKLRPDEAVLILHRESRAPITYRLPEIMPKGVGPSPQWITRTMSVVLGVPGTVKNRGLQYIGKPGAARLHVLDIVAADSARWLSPYGRVSKPGYIAGTEDYVAAPRVALASIGALPTSERVHGYVTVLADEILSHIDDSLIGEPPRVDEVHWKNLRGVIADLTMREVRGRADPEKVADVAVGHAVELMQVEMINVNATLARRKQYLDEIAVSIEANIRYLRERLATLITKPVTRDGLVEALERVITSKSNLFKAMEAKNTVLSSTLLRSSEFSE